MKNFNIKLFAKAGAAANADADAGSSTIALPGLRPGELKIALNILGPALYQNKKKVKVVGDTMYFNMSPSQCWKLPVARSPNTTKNHFGQSESMHALS